MADPKLQELYEQLKQVEQRSAAHETLIRAIETLEQESKPFRVFLGRKKLPTVKAADRQRLMELHQSIGSAAEALIQGEENEELKDMVRKISALSSNNYKALLAYDPAKTPKTLNAIEEESKTLTLHVGPNDIQADSLGANLSERIPLSFYDGKGNKINGVFTKKKTLEAVGSFRKALEDSVETIQDPQARQQTADAIRELCEKLSFRGTLQSHEGKGYDFTGDPSKAVCNLLNMSKETTTNKEGKSKTKISAALLKHSLQQLLPRETFEKIDPNSLFRMAEKLTEIRLPITINMLDAKIQDGSRLDNRNAAMSTVADLLGMPDVVARSRPMKLVDANGNVQEGTFMELAKGMDINNLNREAFLIDERSLAGGTGKGLRDLANLQILDYICGNVDRHAANFTYQFDGNKKFSGVQGIDNDCAFGCLNLNGDTGTNRLVGVKHMVAVPRKTYERLQQLDPSSLKYALRGYGLSEKELNAAGQRLENLKTKLRAEKEFFEARDRNQRDRPLVKDHVRILEDKDWTKYEASEFIVREMKGKKNVAKNTLSLAIPHVIRMADTYDKQLKDYRDLSRTIAVGSGNRADTATVGQEYTTAYRLNKQLDKRTWFGFSSPAYRAMHAAVKAYAEFQKSLRERLKQAGDEEARRSSTYHGELEAVVTPADLERMRQLSRNMKDAAQTYLNGKLVNGQVPERASDYTKSRIQIAQDVLHYGEQGEVIRPEEQRKAEANQTQADEQIKERISAHLSDVPKTCPSPGAIRS